EPALPDPPIPAPPVKGPPVTPVAVPGFAPVDWAEPAGPGLKVQAATTAPPIKSPAKALFRILVFTSNRIGGLRGVGLSGPILSLLDGKTIKKKRQCARVGVNAQPGTYAAIGVAVGKRAPRRPRPAAKTALASCSRLRSGPDGSQVERARSEN